MAEDTDVIGNEIKGILWLYAIFLEIQETILKSKLNNARAIVVIVNIQLLHSCKRHTIGFLAFLNDFIRETIKQTFYSFPFQLIKLFSNKTFF